jgi:hypothetical protein
LLRAKQKVDKEAKRNERAERKRERRKKREGRKVDSYEQQVSSWTDATFNCGYLGSFEVRPPPRHLRLHISVHEAWSHPAHMSQYPLHSTHRRPHTHGVIKHQDYSYGSQRGWPGCRDPPWGRPKLGAFLHVCFWQAAGAGQVRVEQSKAGQGDGHVTHLFGHLSLWSR